MGLKLLFIIFCKLLERIG